MILLTLEQKGNILMTDFKLFLESPCFCILRQMVWTMHFEISFLLCYTYANQRMHWSTEMHIACNFKCPQFFQFLCTEISKSYGQYFKSMLKFQMHVRVKYSALTFQTITPLSVRIATLQGDYCRDSTCMMLRYA